MLVSSRLYCPKPGELPEADSPALARELEGVFTAALGVETRVLRRRYGTDDVLVFQAHFADAAEMARCLGRWRALVALRLGGVTAVGIMRIAALRRGCEECHPALDGFAADERAAFARWLYQRGRIEG